MTRTLLALFCGFFTGACAHTPSAPKADEPAAIRPANEKSFEPAATRPADHNLPIALGASRAEANQKFGEPTRSREDFDTFGEFGLIIDYRGDVVSAITATLITNGIAYRGKILGVALEDTLDSARALWGEPRSRVAGSSHDHLQWVVRDYFIEVELWNSTHEEQAWGHVIEDTVKRIKVRSAANI